MKYLEILDVAMVYNKGYKGGELSRLEICNRVASTNLIDTLLIIEMFGFFAKNQLLPNDCLEINQLKISRSLRNKSHVLTVQFEDKFSIDYSSFQCKQIYVVMNRLLGRIDTLEAGKAFRDHY